MEDEGEIFGNLPPPRTGRRSDDFDDREVRLNRAYRMMRDEEGPLPPRPSGKGGPSIGQGPPPPIPVNTVAPVASGTATVGSTLSCTTGTWTGSPTPTYTYQWQRGGVNISGATSSTYVTVTADGGTNVSCTVTATNAAGSASATSNALAIAAGATGSTWSAADATTTNMTLSNGGMTVAQPGAATNWAAIRTSSAKSSGKLYVEFAVTVSLTDWQWSLGLANSTITLIGGVGLGSSNYSCGILVGGDGTNVSAGFTSNYNSSLPAYQPSAGTVFALAVDFSAGSIWIAQDNTWSNSSNPAAGSLPVVSFVPATVGALFAAMSIKQNNSGVWTLQPTAASQKYAPPAGFTPWDGGGSTTSTPETTITRGRHPSFRNGTAGVTAIHRGGTFVNV